MSSPRDTSRQRNAQPRGSAAGRPGPHRPGSGRARAGRPGREVYRRRRLVAAVLAFAFLGLLALGVSALVSAVRGVADTTAPTGAVATGPTPTTEPSATAGYVPTACAPDALDVVETGARDAYWAGSSVTFTLTVTNIGTVPCLLDGGSAALGVVVTSGSDRVWSSVDCPAGEAERRLLLDTGAAEAITVTWEQTRSLPGCPGGQASAEPGVYRAAFTTDGSVTTLPGWEWVFAIR